MSTDYCNLPFTPAAGSDLSGSPATSPADPSGLFGGQTPAGLIEVATLIADHKAKLAAAVERNLFGGEA